MNLVTDPGCDCGWVIEDAIHYFLECRLYTEARTQLISNLDFLENLEIETLLFGNSALSEEQNLKIFMGIQKYIQQTTRFTSGDH